MPRIYDHRRPFRMAVADPQLEDLKALAKANSVHVEIDRQARERGTPCVVLTARRAGGVELGRFRSCASALRWLRGTACPRNEI